jgi:hypothetical protein
MIGGRDAPQFFELATQSVAKRAFGAQLFEQLFGLGQIVLGDFGALEKSPPAFGNFFFGKQTTPLDNIGGCKAATSILFIPECSAREGKTGISDLPVVPKTLMLSRTLVGLVGRRFAR